MYSSDQSIVIKERGGVKSFEKLSLALVSKQSHTTSREVLGEGEKMKLDEDSRQQFAEYLRSLRMKAGLTQKEVEARTGISGPYIALLENARRNPPKYEYLERLAKAYGVSIEQMARKAGHGQGEEMSVLRPERIHWGYQCALADPDFVHGIRVRPDGASIELQAYVLELYQRATGRNLLRPDEQVALEDSLAVQTEPTPPPDAEQDPEQDRKVEPTPELPSRNIQLNRGGAKSASGEKARTGHAAQPPAEADPPRKIRLVRRRTKPE